MSSREETAMTENEMGEWMQSATARPPAADISIPRADPFAPQSDDEADWEAITAREKLTWGADLTDDEESAPDE